METGDLAEPGKGQSQPRVPQQVPLYPVPGQWAAELPPNHCGR